MTMTPRVPALLRALCVCAFIAPSIAPAVAASGRDLTPPPPHQQPVRQIRYLMGTLCEITAYADSSAAAEAAIGRAFDEIKRIDALLSNWKETSELMQLNHAAAAGDSSHRPSVAAGEELFERLQVALAVAQATDGRFDPTVGPLVRAWGFLPSTSTDPSSRAAAVEAARKLVGWQKVQLDPAHRTVQFAVPGMEIDFGGIAKGYAADRASQVLQHGGVSAALVSLGGSSIRALGTPPGRAGWPVLVRDPRDGETPAAWLELRDGEALGTSGTYENTLGEGKRRKSHIINPATGEALGGAESVTVLLDQAETADALTKFFMLQGPLPAQDRAKWLARFPKASIMLMTVQQGRLLKTTAGDQPQRFRTLERQQDRTHAAKAN